MLDYKQTIITPALRPRASSRQVGLPGKQSAALQQRYAITLAPEVPGFCASVAESWGRLARLRPLLSAPSSAGGEARVFIGSEMNPGLEAVLSPLCG